MLHLDVLELFPWKTRLWLERPEPRFRLDRVHAAALGYVNLAVGSLGGNVLKVGMESHGHARRKRPRCRGPYDDGDAAACERRVKRGRVRQNLVLGIDGPAAMVFVFHLGFGKSRLVRDAPIHGLEAAIDVSFLEKIQKRLRDHGFVAVVHGQVRFFPLAEHAQALEVGALQRHEFFRVAAAGAPDFHHRHAGLPRAELLIHVDFNWQTVAIPAGDKGRVETRQGFRLDDQIFQDLGQRRAQVQSAVGVRRTIVKREDRGALAALANALIKSFLPPPVEPLWLVRRKVGLHEKGSLGEIESGFQVERHGHEPSGRPVRFHYSEDRIGVSRKPVGENR